MDYLKLKFYGDTADIHFEYKRVFIIVSTDSLNSTLDYEAFQFVIIMNTLSSPLRIVLALYTFSKLPLHQYALRFLGFLALQKVEK